MIPGLFIAGVILLLTVLVVSVIDESSSLTSGLVLLNLGHAGSLLAFWHFALRRRAPASSFGVILLLALAAFRVVAAMGLLLFGPAADQWPPTVQYPERVLDVYSLGESITSTGMLVLVAAWRLAIGRDLHRVGFAPLARQTVSGMPIAMYLIALAFEVSRRLLGLEFGSVQQILSISSALGVAAIFYISARRTTGAAQIASAIALALPLVAAALGSGMKESILFPLLPAAILAWGRANAQLRIAIIIACTFILIILQAYVGFVRDISWGSNVNFQSTELLSKFGEHISEEDFPKLLQDISLRLDLSKAHAITVQVYKDQGPFADEIFLSIPASLIPRFLWSEKPVVQPGALHTARILGLPSERVSEITSATAPGFFAELYLWAGWTATIGGALLYGLLFATLQRRAAMKADPFWTQALTFLAVYWAIRFDENHVAYAFTGMFFFYIFMVIVSRISHTNRIALKLQAVQHRIDG